jgi:hypothetical protein
MRLTDEHSLHTINIIVFPITVYEFQSENKMQRYTLSFDNRYRWEPSDSHI